MSNRRQIINLLKWQASEVRRTRQWHLANELMELKNILWDAKPRAKNIRYRGIWFPIWHGLSYRVVVCPDCKTPLIGEVDL